MTQIQLYPERPSMVGPILLTALVAVLMFAAPSLAGQSGMELACCCNCSAGLMAGILGLLPAFLLVNKSPYFTGGHGFVTAFLGVGLGSAVGVWIHLAYPGYTEEQLREFLEKVLAEGQLPPESEEDAKRVLAGMVRMQGAILAVVGSILAGFVGMITVAVSRRRHPQPPPIPVNPWSSPEA